MSHDDDLPIIGADPGINGALAARWIASRRMEIERMPVIGRDVNEQLIAALFRKWRPKHLVLERVHSMPKQGVVSTFRFGQGFGALRGVAAGLGIPTTVVEPGVWKRDMRVPADKDLARARAVQLLPDMAADFKLKKDDGKAEAALLALWGEMVEGLR